MANRKPPLTYWELTTGYKDRVVKLNRGENGLFIADLEHLKLPGARIVVPTGLEVWLVLQMQSHKAKPASEFLATTREGSKGVDAVYVSMLEKGWGGLEQADIDLLKAPWYDREKSRLILDRSRFGWHFPLTNGFYDPSPREDPHPFAPR